MWCAEEMHKDSALMKEVRFADKMNQDWSVIQYSINLSFYLMQMILGPESSAKIEKRRIGMFGLPGTKKKNPANMTAASFIQ